MQRPMTHAEIIEQLGGSKAVMDALNAARPERPISHPSVSNWKVRGIPWRHRPLIARLAIERSILLPSDFLFADAA